MSEDEILKAYYLINSRFVSQKYRGRYGRFFWLNPLFYRQTLLTVESVGDLRRLVSVGWKLMKSYLWDQREK